MIGRVRTCVVAVLACAGLMMLVGCGKKKQEGAQTQIDSASVFAEEDTAVLNDTASSGKTLEDVEQYLDSKPAGAASAASGEFVENGKYAIQISSSRFERSSQRMIDKLKEQNIPAYLSEVENPTSDLLGTYYRVRVGYFGGVSSARSYGPALEAMGYDWWVDNRSNDNIGSGEAAAAPAPSSSSSGTDMGFGSSSSFEATSGTEGAVSSMPASSPSAAPASSSTPATGATSAPADFGTTSSGTTSGSDWGTVTDTAGTGWE